MLEEIGTVVDVEKDVILVETRSRSSCSHCSSNGCTTSVVAKLFGVRRNRLQLENSLDAKLGDRVVIGIPDDVLVKASLWAYLLPMIFMLAGPALGGAFGVSEDVQILLALTGLAVGFSIVHGSTRNPSSQKCLKPRLLSLADSQQVRVQMPKLLGRQI